MTFSMHELIICIKGLVLISIVWMFDLFMLQLSTVNFFSPEVRGFFVETKEFLSWVVSILVLIATIIKIRKDTKK